LTKNPINSFLIGNIGQSDEEKITEILSKMKTTNSKKAKLDTDRPIKNSVVSMSEAGRFYQFTYKLCLSFHSVLYLELEEKNSLLESLKTL